MTLILFCNNVDGYATSPWPEGAELRRKVCFLVILKPNVKGGNNAFEMQYGYTLLLFVTILNAYLIEER